VLRSVETNLMHLQNNLPDIVSIVPQKNIALVDWSMGTTCNYACSYCPPPLHDGKQPWPTEDKWLEILDAMHNHFQRPIQYVLSGGEPTVMPNFDKFLQAIKKHNTENLISVITNGSRTVRWWERYGDLIDTVNLSVHIESCDPEHLLDVAHTFYKPGVNELNVLVAILPELWDKSIACAELLASNSNGYPVSLKRMRIEFGAKSYPYTEEQEHILQTYALFNTYNSEWTLPRAKPKRIGVPHIITYSDGKEELLHANRNINQNHNVFTGMKCYIGIDKIFINQFKEITAGSWCPQANWSHPDKIGRLDQLDKLNWPTEPYICEQPRCMNATDMRTRKHR